MTTVLTRNMRKKVGQIVAKKWALVGQPLEGQEGKKFRVEGLGFGGFYLLIVIQIFVKM
jgi:hypothetical protein